MFLHESGELGHLDLGLLGLAHGVQGHGLGPEPVSLWFEVVCGDEGSGVGGGEGEEEAADAEGEEGDGEGPRSAGVEVDCLQELGHEIDGIQ